jgi:predicted dehydrogenase
MNKHLISSRHSRRLFIRYSSLAVGTAAVSGPFLLRGQNLNSKLNIGVIGAGGKGSSDTDHCATENIVALCDVDKRTLESRNKKYPDAKPYRDFRKMLEEVKNIDAVTVSTPDHCHAAAAIMAMKLGKHVY